MGLVQKKKQSMQSAGKILTPQENRIFQMEKHILIGHYVLIEMKESSLSSNERRLVKNRIAYGLKNKTITREEIDNTRVQIAMYTINKK